jgi:hypothetical protein
MRHSHRELLEKSDMNNVTRARFAGVLALLALAIAAKPAAAQEMMDLQGVWNHNGLMVEDRAIIMNATGGGARIGDYTGMPLTDAARQQADSWMASRQEMAEHQCHPHPAQYTMWGPGNFRITNILDPVTERIIGFVMDGLNGDMERTFWLDGRPHPPEYARHTWAGFSTGVWDGNMLTVTTTHLKEGWVQRNGVHMTDHGTMREHFIKHDDYLTVITIINDPEVFEKPFIRTTQAKFDPSTIITPDECQPFNTSVMNADHPPGFVPHWLPGQNPQLTEFGERFGVPQDAVRGGAKTLYPEYIIELKKMIEAQKKTPASSN